MDKAGSRRSRSVALFGIFLAVMGLALTAGNLDLLPFRPTLLDFAPPALLLVAFDRLLAGRPGKALFFAALATVIGLAHFHPDFRLRDLADLAPLALVALGAVFAWRAIRGKRAAAEGARRSGGDIALFSQVHNRPTDPEYRGGSAIAILGGHQLDLRQARLADEGAVLDVFAFWGGLEVVVPAGMSVNLEVATVLGGAEDKTGGRPSVAGTPRLAIRGMVVMGGLDVHS